MTRAIRKSLSVQTVTLSDSGLAPQGEALIIAERVRGTQTALNRFERCLSEQSLTRIPAERLRTNLHGYEPHRGIR